MVEIKNILIKHKIYRHVKCIYTEENDDSKDSFGFIFGVMGTYISAEIINSIIVRKPVQNRSTRTLEERKKQQEEQEKQMNLNKEENE